MNALVDAAFPVLFVNGMIRENRFVGLDKNSRSHPVDGCVDPLLRVGTQFERWAWLDAHDGSG